MNGEKLSAVSGQQRVKQVSWQLTDQTCELLEGIRCADSLAMFLGQDATASTMKILKANPTELGKETELSTSSTS